MKIKPITNKYFKEYSKETYIFVLRPDKILEDIAAEIPAIFNERYKAEKTLFNKFVQLWCGSLYGIKTPGGFTVFQKCDFSPNRFIARISTNYCNYTDATLVTLEFLTDLSFGHRLAVKIFKEIITDQVFDTDLVL